MARDRAARPEAKPVRLFVAVDLPADVRGELVRAVAPLRADFPKARWVPPENWHVTVKFLGSTYPRLVSRVERATEEVAGRFSAFETHLEGVGSFPNERRARVLWAGLEDPGGELAAVAEALDEALESDFPPEKRGFTAHLTVARFDPLVPLGDMLSTIEVPSARFVVDHLTLFRSHLRRPAPLYEPLLVAPLGGGS
jgi:2'-5' RNA ligase